ncbi:MAG TPA: hypothetical protein VJN48_11040 [Terriglobales bacterium]|nr:hypothetical protein [Terriglobales bacterium]
MPPKAPHQSTGVTRRQFGKQAAFASLSAALAVTPVAGQSDAAPSSVKETNAADDIEARYQQVIRRYGNRLSEEQRKRVRKILAYNEKLLAPIRSFPLDNGQPAATVLKFYEDAEATPRASAGLSRRPTGQKAKE